MGNQVEAGRNGCLNLVKADFNPWNATKNLRMGLAKTNDICHLQLVAHAEDRRKLYWYSVYKLVQI